MAGVMEVSEAGSGVRNRQSHQKVPGARSPNLGSRVFEGGGMGRHQGKYSARGHQGSRAERG